MNTRLLGDVDGLRTFVVVFATGEDPVGGLKAFARDQRLNGAQLTGIGAFERVTVGYFDWQLKDYRQIRVDEQVEVLALTGNIGSKDGSPALHAHVVLGKIDGTAHGGHLLAGTVRPTLEVVVTETPAHLRRSFDEATGLSLIDPRL